MMAPTFLPGSTPGKVFVFDGSTGERLERWPVDARALVESGEYTATAPEGADVPAPTTAGPAPEIATSTLPPAVPAAPAPRKRNR